MILTPDSEFILIIKYIFLLYFVANKWRNNGNSDKLYFLGLQNHTFQVALVINNPPANSGDIRDAGLIPGSGRSPGKENSSPLQYSCLENPTDMGSQRVRHDCGDLAHLHTQNIW